jgi:hypothetical protein
MLVKKTAEKRAMGNLQIAGNNKGLQLNKQRSGIDHRRD